MYNQQFMSDHVGFFFFVEKKVSLSIDQTTLSNTFTTSASIDSSQTIDIFTPTTYFAKECAQTLQVLRTYLTLTSGKSLFGL